MRKFYTVILCLLVFGGVSVAQTTGTLTGVVYDKANNDPLIGANVMVVATQLGASTDIEGKYRIAGVPLGKVDLRISYISYRTKTIQGITINPGKPIVLDVYLDMEELTTDEVLVTAEVARNSENSVLMLQKQSNNIVDGLSAEMIKKNNASDGTDIMKRMTGVTISDGKFAYIRGVSERYNNTMLNNASLPSTDPEKKSFSYDMFPAGLIEQMVTMKSFTPDKPADFSGGLVEITTVDFPSSFLLDFGSSASYNSMATFSNFNTYKGGKTDFLGFDDGTRALPSSVPDEKLTRTTPGLLDIAKSFDNNWSVKKSTAPVNSSVKFAIGDRFDVSENIVFGFIGSYSYGSSYENRKYSEIANYIQDGPRFNYEGSLNQFSVNQSGLLNFSTKLFNDHKISFKNIYNVNTDDETAIFTGSDRSYLSNRTLTSLRYVTRDLLSTQLKGDHSLSFPFRSVIQWNLNYGNSHRDEPDFRRYIYKDALDDPNDVAKLDMSNAYPTRYFGELDDYARGASFDYKFTPFSNPALPSFKVGLFHDFKNREFDARAFGFKNLSGIPDSVLESPIQNVMTPNRFNTNRNRGIYLEEDTKASDSYRSSQKINSMYFMVDFILINDLKVITGIRNEFSEQRIITADIQQNPINKQSSYNDWLPALSLTYELNDEMNIRGAVSRTLARPEFRELAPYQYYDFQANELVEGNPALKRTMINNYDIRYEYFPGGAQLYAISLFKKDFKDPIEQVYTPASGLEPIRSYANATKATTIGVEFETRTKIGIWGYDSEISPLSFTSNLSLISSKIEGIGSGYQVKSRPLQGQASYILNLGIYWDDLLDGFQASATYNRVGEKIAKVGYADLGNTIEMPRNQVDLSATKQLFEHLELKASVKDVLAEDYVRIQKSPVGDKDAERYNRGTTFIIGVSYKL